MTIVFSAIMVDDAVQLVKSLGLFLLAWELKCGLNLNDIVYLGKVHGPFTEDESFQVDHKDLWQ